jgi:hypothetical protein
MNLCIKLFINCTSVEEWLACGHESLCKLYFQRRVVEFVVMNLLCQVENCETIGIPKENDYFEDMDIYVNCTKTVCLESNG